MEIMQITTINKTICEEVHKITNMTFLGINANTEIEIMFLSIFIIFIGVFCLAIIVYFLDSKFGD